MTLFSRGGEQAAGRAQRHLPGAPHTRERADGGRPSPRGKVGRSVFLVGDVGELWPFLVALFVSLSQLQTRCGLQAIISERSW